MSSIGSLTIEMAADIARLRRDMDDAKKVVGGAMQEMQRAADLAKKALVLFAGVATLNGLKNMVANAIEGAAALKDLQQQTGASVEGLSALASVGKFSGTGLETISAGMNRLTKSLSTSTEESRGTASAIKALGIDFAAFSGLSPDEQMLAVAKAMGGFEDGASKSAVAMALFGKEGAKMLPFLADLAEQEELVGKVTSAQAEMADRYSDNLARLQTSGKGWEKQLAMGLLPVLDETATALLGVMNGTGGLKEQMKKLSDDGTLAGWGRGAVTVLSYVADGIEYALRLLRMMGESIGATVADAASMISGVGAAIQKVLKGDFSGALDEMKGISARSATINADLDASLNATWGAQTLGANLRDRIAQIQAVGTVSEKAKAKLNFKDTGPAKEPKAKTEKESDYDKLMAKIREKMAVEQQELEGGKALTDEQKLALDVMVQLRDGKLKLTQVQAQTVAAGLQEVLLNGQLIEQHKAELKWLDETEKANQSAFDARDAEVAKLREQVQAQVDANTQAGLGAMALAGLVAARLEDAAATADQRAEWADTAMLGEEVVQQYRDKATALRALADAKRAGAFNEDEKRINGDKSKVVDDYLKQDIGSNLAAGFDQASQSLGTFVQGFGALIDAQDKYNEARNAAAGDTAKLAEIEQHHQRAQLNSYASLAGAAKGFFKEGSSGYKAMGAAEKVFRALELGTAIENAARQIGLIGAVTAAKTAGDAAQADSLLVSAGKQIAAFFGIGTAAAATGVANQAAGDPYTALPRMAAMAAAMAALGFATGAIGGGGSSHKMPTNTGTGTVLGDASAQSESIGNSIDRLADVDLTTMRYSAQMAASLRNIESSIAGVATLIAQSGGLDTATAGITVGAIKATGLQGLIGLDNKIVSKLAGSLPLIGGFLSERLGKDFQKFFGSSQKIVGQGILGGPQTLGAIQKNGFDAQFYADVETKRKFIVTTSKKVGMQTVGADDQTNRQFTLILNSFSDAVKAAGEPLGMNLKDVQSKLDGFVVDLGRIELSGLTGKEVSEKLTAVFSAAGDKIAKAALPGLEDFQKVGEGYFEAAVRVASGSEEATTQLKRLGVQSIALAKLDNKQADVAAELVRQSLMAAEGVSSLSGILQVLGGSASDIATAYSTLADVRTSLQLLGVSGSALSASLLAGAGGVDALSDAVSAFESGFLSSADQVRSQAARMAMQFDRLGLTMPKSSADFVALVRGIDTSTEAGQSLLGSVLGLSDGFASLLGAIRETGSGIADEIARIKGASSAAGRSFAELQSAFAIQTAQARSGDQSAIDALPQISQALLASAEQTASTSDDLARVQASTLASLQATLDLVSDPSRRLAGIPGFASGGDFAGGLRIVGEHGPELEATGPARIFNASQTAQMLGGGGGDNSALLARLDALTAEVRGFRGESQMGDAQIATHVRKTANYLERVVDGPDAVRTTT